MSQLLGQIPRLTTTSTTHPTPEEENLYINPAYPVLIPWILSFYALFYTECTGHHKNAIVEKAKPQP